MNRSTPPSINSLLRTLARLFETTSSLIVPFCNPNSRFYAFIACHIVIIDLALRTLSSMFPYNSPHWFQSILPVITVLNRLTIWLHILSVIYAIYRISITKWSPPSVILWGFGVVFFPICLPFLYWIHLRKTDTPQSA